jgi:hypothetical protein
MPSIKPTNGIRVRFTVAPEIVYLPILLLSLVGLSLETNNFGWAVGPYRNGRATRIPVSVL